MIKPRLSWFFKDPFKQAPIQFYHEPRTVQVAYEPVREPDIF